jgi:UV DNA damage endonuclease
MRKIHFSSPRGAGRTEEHRVEGEGAARRRWLRPGQHDDWIDGTAFVAFMEEMGEAPFNVMLEAKQKDHALLRLREAIVAAGPRSRIW